MDVTAISAVTRTSCLKVISKGHMPSGITHAKLRTIGDRFISTPILSRFPLALRYGMSGIAGMNRSCRFIKSVIGVLISRSVLASKGVSIGGLRTVAFSPTNKGCVTLNSTIKGTCQRNEGCVT